jgi:ribose 5-phosphate isomerase B
MIAKSINLYLGCDHAGFELKQQILEHWFKQDSITIRDLGCYSSEACDYPDFAHLLANNILQDSLSARGVLICGSGIGMSISVNRHAKVRGALCRNTLDASLARLHNNANVLVLGARYCVLEQALEMLNVFLNTEFEDGRHASRVEKIEVLDDELYK